MMAPLALSIDAATRYCAVFGCPIRHSASPAMQNAGLAALALNWRYLAFDVPAEALAAAVGGAKAMGLVGLNLTVPHKLAALELMDVLDESAREWGAVNTVRFEGRDPGGPWRPLGEWSDPPRHVRAHGFNTDAGAIARALREELGLSLSGASILLLGSGGRWAHRRAQAGCGRRGPAVPGQPYPQQGGGLGPGARDALSPGARGPRLPIPAGGVSPQRHFARFAPGNPPPWMSSSFACAGPPRCTI